MNCHYIPFEQINYLSKSDKAYAVGAEFQQSFYKYPVTLAAFEQVIEDKKKDKTNREVLVKVLEEQYQGVETTTAVRENIALLKRDTTFTIITAHQPSLFTGPLYFIYKTISAINLAENLKAAYPAYDFVPVFWLGSEDHDFEEINHLNIFGKSVNWENDEAGATGMMNTASLAPTLEMLKSILGSSEKAEKIYTLLVACYQSGENYARSTFLFTNALFKEYGLVVSLTNHAALKRLFIPIMEDELLRQTSKKLVDEMIEEKEAVGLKIQATPRDINLFYMKEGFRERIVEENGTYTVLNQDFSFSKEEILKELQTNPQHFSPNVVLRPIYQELLFPNLAYIGGGGELAYWRERMTQFDYFGLNYPMLVRRDSVLWIDKGNLKRLNKLDVSITDIFEEEAVLVRNYVESKATAALTIEAEKKQMEALFEGVRAKAKKVDASLERAVLAEKTKQLKALNQLETRLIRSEKKKHETSINQLKNIKEKLFPNNGLQERHDNFIQYYLRHGDDFITTLKKYLNPLQKDFKVIVEG